MDDDDAGTPRPPRPQTPMAIVGYCHRLPGGLRNDANGYMRSEGAFVFALKPLAAAERDGDHVSTLPGR